MIIILSLNNTLYTHERYCDEKDIYNIVVKLKKLEDCPCMFYGSSLV